MPNDSPNPSTPTISVAMNVHHFMRSAFPPVAAALIFSTASVAFSRTVGSQCSEICFAETSSEKSSTLAVLFEITHGEYAESREIRQFLIPYILGILGGNAMDLLECCDIGDSDFSGGYANDRTILRVQSINVKDAATTSHSLLESEIGEVADPRTRDVLQR